MTTAFVLSCAMLLDALLGEPAWAWRRIPHPAVLMGRAVSWIDRALNKGAAKRAKGVMGCAVLSAGAVAIGWCISLLGPVTEIIMVAILIAQRSLTDHVLAVATGLASSLADARASVSMIVSRETAHMNESDVTRAAIESAAENLSDGVVAPAFWFAVGGLPAICLYKAVNTADSMVGYRNQRYEEFGWAAARLDDALNLIPARATALLIAAVTLQFDFRGIRKDARLHRSPNAGWPEAAMARALGIALAGPRMYDGCLRKLSWVNAGARHEADARDINRCVVILWRSWGMLFALSTLTAVMMI